MKTKLEEEIIKVCLKIAQRKEGGLIIVGENVKYIPLVDQTISSFNVLKNLKLLESLALMDGAVIINKKGFMVAYGVKIKSNKVLNGFGTRHSAALSASINLNNICHLISEEERKVKIFKEGKIIMQIDALEKNITKKVSEISNLLESFGVSALGGVGAVSLGLIGITLMPGVIIFGGGAYYLLKKFKRYL